MLPTTQRDTIPDEIHQTRRKMAERFGGDLAALLADARARQAASGRPVWQGKSNAGLTHRQRGGASEGCR